MDPSRHRRPDPKPKFKNPLTKDDFDDFSANGIGSGSFFDKKIKIMDHYPVFFKVGIFLLMDPSSHRRPDPKFRFKNPLAKED